MQLERIKRVLLHPSQFADETLRADFRIPEPTWQNIIGNLIYFCIYTENNVYLIIYKISGLQKSVYVIVNNFEKGDPSFTLR